MKDMANYTRLLNRVVRLHNAALVSSDAELTIARASFRRRVQKGAWRERPDGSVLDGSVEPVPRWISWRGLALAGAAVLVLGLFAVRELQHLVHRVQVSPEPRAAAALVPTKAPVSAAADVRPPPDPCIVHLRATGKEPLIDDFEDQNPLIAALENRVALWSIFRDSDSPGTFNTITPSLLPRPTRKNRYALHAVGGAFLNWGVNIQFSFQPACYDASAYSGVSLRAKGPGRIFVGMREIAVVPIEYGGTCKSDCYNAHQKKVELSPFWRSYTVLWSEMRQRGYDKKPLDVTRVNGMALLIETSDTPYDLWIDDVKFVTQ